MIKESLDIDKYIDKNKELISSHLDKYLEPSYPKIIWEAMRYTTLADGKRIRPLMVIESAITCGGNIDNVIPTACALEMIHSYSLIHDDLPCMDNDDYRRGRLTNHKIYGESIAVLAGDALLSYAPQIIIKYTPDNVDKKILLTVIDELFSAVGPSGLVAGQVVDIDSESKDIDIPTFTYIHTKKTGKLFQFAMKSGALISKAPLEKIKILTEYGQIIGYAFQIADDILDIISTKELLGKTPGKDKNASKKTHPALFGLSQSREEVKDLCTEAKNILIENNLDTPLLIKIADDIVQKVIEK